jgi:hypothetical protein
MQFATEAKKKLFFNIFTKWINKVIYYRVINKALRDFRSLRYSSQDGHAEG